MPMWSVGTLFERLGHFLGGYAFQQPDLRRLYAAIFLSFLGTSISFPLRMLYAQAHGATPAQLGIMGGSFLLAPVLAQVPVGRALDRWGRVPVLMSGLILHPIIAVLYIPLNSPNELIGLRFVEGIVVSVFQPGLGAYIADATPEGHRAEAYGALSATLNGGLMIGPFIGGLIGQYFGFTSAFLVNFVVELLALPIVFGRIHEPAVRRGASCGEARVGWLELFTLSLVAVYFAAFCNQIVLGALQSLWAIWIHDLGGSYTFIGFTFVVFALPQIFLGTLAGRLADRHGRAVFVFVATAIAGGVYIAYGYLYSLGIILLLGVIEGVALVFVRPIILDMLAEASPERARGRVQGISGAFGSAGGAAAGFLSIPLYHGSHPAPFLSSGLIIIAGGASAAVAAGRIARKRVGRPAA